MKKIVFIQKKNSKKHNSIIIQFTGENGLNDEFYSLITNVDKPT